jgi:hypothetical protein
MSVNDANQPVSELVVRAAAAPPPPVAPAAAEFEFWGLKNYIKSIVFGGLDGIVTTFAVIASVVGADLGIVAVIVTGFAKLLGDGLSMGLGDAISEHAEQSMIRAELAREEWEYKNYPDGEIAEMVAIYESKGFSNEEAQRAMALMTKKPDYTNVFLDHMMLQELDHTVPGPDENPLKDGSITFASFMLFGSLVRARKKPTVPIPPFPPPHPPPPLPTPHSPFGHTSFFTARATPTTAASSAFASPCALCASLHWAQHKRCC